MLTQSTCSFKISVPLSMEVLLPPELIAFLVTDHLSSYESVQLSATCRSFRRLVLGVLPSVTLRRDGRGTACLLMWCSRLRACHVARGVQVTNDLLALLPSKTLTTLSLSDSRHDIDNKALVCFTRLERLCLGGALCISSYAVNRLSRLHTLFLGRNVLVGSNGLLALPCLTELHCGFSDCLVDETVLLMASRLTVLRLGRSTAVTNVGIAALTRLRSLYLDENRRITDTGLAPLTQLETLRLGACCQITTRVLATLTRLTSLRFSMNWHGTDALLARLTALRRLYLGRSTKVTDAGLSLSLQSLGLDANHNISLAALVRLTQLQELRVRADDPLLCQLEPLKARDVVIRVVGNDDGDGPDA